MLRRNTIFTKLIRELGLQSNEAEIKTKASELQQEVDSKIDSKLMTHWPSCKPVLCTHIACEMLKVPFDKKSVVKLASTTEENYYSSLSYIKKTLGISTLTFDLLATRFGCPKTLPYLETMFETFKNNWTQKLTSANIEAIDWDDCVFKVAIFWCVCKAFGGQSQITQQELIDLPEVATTRVKLNKHTKLVDTYCKGYIAELKSQKKYPGRRISFKKPIPLKKLKPQKSDGKDKMNDDEGEEKRGRKRKFQDERKEPNNKDDETKVGNPSKSIDKGKKRAVEPEEENEKENEEEISCIGPMCSRGEMKIVNYWETQEYNDYLAWREIITQKISEKMEKMEKMEEMEEMEMEE